MLSATSLFRLFKAFTLPASTPVRLIVHESEIMNQPKLKQLTVLSKPTTVSSAKRCSDRYETTYSRLITLGLVTVILGLVLGNAKVGDAQQAQYTDLRSLRAEALNDDFGTSVDFEATVTYVNEGREFIFVQKDDDAVFVYQPEVGHVRRGHQVRKRIEGSTRRSYQSQRGKRRICSFDQPRVTNAYQWRYWNDTTS